ncbi:MAG: hypothetical protein Q4D58_10425 [Synergistaceae bacterium]|nr:hypothetical protein [Synergistaceae bacterium]
MSKFKKYILPAILSIIITCAAGAAAEKIRLPEIKGWENGELRTTEMAALSGFKGTWQERTYRTNSGTPFKAIWVDGAGAKGWDVNEMSDDHGEIWGGETSEKLTVAGHKAMLEYRPVIGYSLIINVAKDGVLTLESQVSTQKHLIEAAETLIENMK